MFIDDNCRSKNAWVPRSAVLLPTPTVEWLIEYTVKLVEVRPAVKNKYALYIIIVSCLPYC